MQEAMTWVNNGLAVLIVIAGGLGIYRAASWIGQHFALPLRDAGILHLQKTNEMLQATCETQRQTQQTMEKLGERISNLSDDVAEVKASVQSCRGR
jgi:hypothetical protein